MNRCLGRAARVAITFLVLSILVRNTGADDVSTGPKGINSQGLALTGKGITLGQLEIKRPGLPTKDTAGKSNTTVTPSAVFIAGTAVAFPAQQDIGVDSHAEGVAGIMIAKPPAPISVA